MNPIDLKHLESRMEGLTQHLLALAEEARSFLAKMDARAKSRPQPAAVVGSSSPPVAAAGVAEQPLPPVARGEGKEVPGDGIEPVPANGPGSTPAPVSASASAAAVVEGGGRLQALLELPPPTVCLEPLRQRTEAAMAFLYEDPRAVHRGITYLDYPGSDRAEKRMNFAMFRRGVHGFNRQVKGLQGAALRQKLHMLSEKNRENGKKHLGTKRPKW